MDVEGGGQTETKMTVSVRVFNVRVGWRNEQNDELSGRKPESAFGK